MGRTLPGQALVIRIGAGRRERAGCFFAVAAAARSWRC